jgi:hypothetical protein
MLGEFVRICLHGEDLHKFNCLLSFRISHLLRGFKDASTKQPTEIEVFMGNLSVSYVTDFRKSGSYASSKFKSHLSNERLRCPSYQTIDFTITTILEQTTPSVNLALRPLHPGRAKQKRPLARGNLTYCLRAPGTVASSFHSTTARQLCFRRHSYARHRLRLTRCSPSLILENLNLPHRGRFAARPHPAVPRPHTRRLCRLRM